MQRILFQYALIRLFPGVAVVGRTSIHSLHFWIMGTDGDAICAI